MFLPQVMSLFEGEEVFGAPVAAQAFGDDVAAGFDAMVLQGGELLRIAFTVEDGLEDRLAGHAGEIADDVLELDVHLREGLVQVADAAAGGAHEAIAMAQDGAHGADLIHRTEAAAQQADGVEVLEPLAVLHVGLAPGQVFTVARIDQADLDAGGFEDLEERDPIYPGGFHGHGGDGAFLQPVAQGVEIFGEGGEGADGTRAGARRHGDVDLAGADVDAGGVRMKGGQCGRDGFWF